VIVIVNIMDILIADIVFLVILIADIIILVVVIADIIILIVVITDIIILGKCEPLPCVLPCLFVARNAQSVDRLCFVKQNFVYS